MSEHQEQVPDTHTRAILRTQRQNRDKRRDRQEEQTQSPEDSALFLDPATPEAYAFATSQLVACYLPMLTFCHMPIQPALMRLLSCFLETKAIVALICDLLEGRKELLQRGCSEPGSYCSKGMPGDAKALPLADWQCPVPYSHERVFFNELSP